MLQRPRSRWLRHDGRGRDTWRSVIRADGLDRLTKAGWAALQAYGVRTVIDLRNDHEIGHDVAPRPRELTNVHVAMDDIADSEFWESCWTNELDGSPLYYRPFLERKPERCAAVVGAIAHAEPGGVVYHCGRGRDRTGLITLLLLVLVGVAPDDIVGDYELSTARVRRLDTTLEEEDQGSVIANILERKRTSARAVILDILESLDADAYLRSAGVSNDDVASVRTRLWRAKQQ